MTCFRMFIAYGNSNYSVVMERRVIVIVIVILLMRYINF